jgi:tetraspanin-18
LLIAAGILAVAAGIWILLSANSFLTIMRSAVSEKLTNNLELFMQPPAVHQAAYIIIAAGALIILISFLGCWGAYRESKYCLTFYGLFLIIILLMEIAAVSLAANYPIEAKEKTRAVLKSSIKQYYAAEEKTSVAVAWDYTMSYMQCCGVDSYEDFQESNWTQANNNKKIPEACCILEGDISKFQPKDPKCTQSPSDSNSYWKTGCYNAILGVIRKSKSMAIGIGIGLVLFKLVLIFLACYLCRSLRAGERSRQMGPE